MPLVFDYRNGHRGMGNNTDEVRPVLYLTYSANGKFTDEVNFSKRRYHKLGEMIAAPKSREERQAMREGGGVKVEEEGELMKKGESDKVMKTSN